MTDTTLIGAPVWNDIVTSDPEATQDFYVQLFGWTAEESGTDFGHYVMFRNDGEPVAGLAPSREPGGHPDFWAVYLNSGNAAGTVQKAQASGGQIFLPAVAVGDLGSMAMLADADQATVGVWQPGNHRGFTVGVACAPVWHELNTVNYDAALQFYREVFDWDIHPMSETADFRYSTLGEGDDASAGILDAANFLPEGVPPHWSVYFGAEDTDAAVQRVAELGGTVRGEVQDTPWADG